MEHPGPKTYLSVIADVAVIVVFVLIGRRTHNEDAGMAGFLRVFWPFAVGLAVGWLTTGLARAPLAWRRAVPAWLLTVAVGMALRIVVEGHAFKVSFTVVALLFTGAGLLGWRAVVVAARRRMVRPG
jgi:Protein of unknown function (DUF3054)